MCSMSRFHNGIIKILEAPGIRLSPLYQNTTTCLHQQFNFAHSHQPIQIAHICITKHISVLIYQYVHAHIIITLQDLQYSFKPTD